MLFDLTRKTAICDLQDNSFRKEEERRMVYRIKKIRMGMKKEMHETFTDHQQLEFSSESKNKDTG